MLSSCSENKDLVAHYATCQEKKKKKATVCGFDLQMYECLSWLLEGKGFDQHIISVIENDYRHVISYLEW